MHRRKSDVVYWSYRRSLWSWEAGWSLRSWQTLHQQQQINGLIDKYTQNNNDLVARTLSPGGPGGPSFPELPWKDKKQKGVEWWTSYHRHKLVGIKYFTFGPAFPVGPLGPLSPRGPFRTRWAITTTTNGTFVTWKVLASPLILRHRHSHVHVPSTKLAICWVNTNRWSSLSTWAGLSCCSLWTNRTRTRIKRWRLVQKNDPKALTREYS